MNKVNHDAQIVTLYDLLEETIACGYNFEDAVEILTTNFETAIQDYKDDNGIN